jgi:hypothetical protein
MEIKENMPKAIPVDLAQKATIEWLLEPQNSSVRYLTLTGLLGRSARHPGVREARAAIMRTGSVSTILDLQEPEGCCRVDTI